jgi:hypothetical protein
MKENTGIGMLHQRATRCQAIAIERCVLRRPPRVVDNFHFKNADVITGIELRALQNKIKSSSNIITRRK